MGLQLGEWVDFCHLFCPECPLTKLWATMTMVRLLWLTGIGPRRQSKHTRQQMIFIRFVIWHYFFSRYEATLTLMWNEFAQRNAVYWRLMTTAGLSWTGLSPRLDFRCLCTSPNYWPSFFNTIITYLGLNTKAKFKILYTDKLGLQGNLVSST